MTFFSKHYHPPGTPPGTLVEHTASVTPFTLRVTDYSADVFTDEPVATAAECRDYLQHPTTTWIQVQGSPPPDALRELGEIFGLHSLALEDVLNKGQRPKVEAFDDELFVVLSLPSIDDGEITIHQVSLFFGKDYLVSFQDIPGDFFAPVRKRLMNAGGKFRTRGADYLLYALIDIIIDAGFPVLDRFGEALDELETELLNTPGRETLHDIHHNRREMLLLRRMLWPQREVMNSLLRDEHPLIDADTRLYLRDCYDHTVQIIELLETYRDMLTSMLDVYMSSISNRTNDVMRVLTIIATIFIPLTFIVGVYGMNFGNKTNSPWAMPELNWYYGYPLLWVVMVMVVMGMLWFFKRKKWF
ncbi:MAG: magnesium/cobalt transporter CorA [Gammaproteobacteria bacterium]|nr:magnesium/cobalt transporter CorA [Gammaproteobacteria bacterium]